MKYTVFCMVCGSPMQRERMDMLPICSRECRRYWNMDDEERRSYQIEKIVAEMEEV